MNGELISVPAEYSSAAHGEHLELRVRLSAFAGMDGVISIAKAMFGDANYGPPG